MEFSYTEEQLALRKAIAGFAAKELVHGAAQRDAAEVFPHAEFRKLADMGLTGIGIGAEYDGTGGDLRLTCTAVEEMARFDPSMSLILLAHLSLAAVPIARFGTAAQRQKYVPAMAMGEAIGAFCLTEPNAGSDAGSISTAAVKKDGRYILNGSKIFITNGDVANTFIVFALQNKEKKSRGITGFIVEKGFKGLSVQKQQGKMGMRASSIAEVFFSDCEVPLENVLGEEFTGFGTALQILDASRPVIGAQAVGIAQGCLDLAIKHVRQRKQFGRPIADNQGIQWMLADMATEVQAARLLVYLAADLRDRELPFTKEASMAKLFASETAMKVATQAVQLHGGAGYFKHSPVERFFRDAKVTEIYEGTSQIQRLVIARNLLRD